MLEKDKWYNCSFSFQLKEGLDIDDAKLLEIVGAVGRAIGIEGLVANIEVTDIKPEIGR